MANLEYLKNVLLQFIFLRSGSERQALLPVIHTMLQLSPEEKSKLAAIAQGTYQINTACRICQTVLKKFSKAYICMRVSASKHVQHANSDAHAENMSGQ